MLATTTAGDVATQAQPFPPVAAHPISRGRASGARIDGPAARTLCILLGYAALALLLFANVWQSPGTRWVGGRIDPPLFMWDLVHAPHAVLHGQNPFIADSVNYPAGANEMWNTSIVAVGLIFAPVTLLLGPIVSFNLLITLSVALSGFAAYLLARRLDISVAGASAAGLLFEFEPYISAHEVAHANLTCVAFVPILFLLVHELVVRQRWHWARTGLLLGLAASVQLLISEEVLASSVVTVAIAILVLFLTARYEVRSRAKYGILTLATAAATFLVLAGYPLLVQFFGPQRYSGIAQPSALFPADVLNV